jgi:hypothetical protein
MTRLPGVSVRYWCLGFIGARASRGCVAASLLSFAVVVSIVLDDGGWALTSYRKVSGMVMPSSIFVIVEGLFAGKRILNFQDTLV